MLGSFRIRLFLVLALVALTLTMLNSGGQIRHKIEPVLQYIMEKDYGWDERIFSLLDSRTPEEQFQAVSTSSTSVINPPCETGEVERHFGWYWDPVSQKQEFSSGVTLSMPVNSLISAALGGKVEEISTGEDEGRVVRVRHGEELVSIYTGLKEVLVSEGTEVSTGEPLGKSLSVFYFELRNQNGPLNPETLFK